MWMRVRQQARATLPKDHGRPHRIRRAAYPRASGLITWTTLALMTVGSVGSLGSTPALSVFGLASVSLYLLPAVVFLAPVTLVAAELASGWSGGVYNWVREWARFLEVEAAGDGAADVVADLAVPVQLGTLVPLGADEFVTGPAGVGDVVRIGVAERPRGPAPAASRTAAGRGRRCPRLPSPPRPARRGERARPR
jgi:hypothetical protein